MEPTKFFLNQDFELTNMMDKKPALLLAMLFLVSTVTAATATGEIVENNDKAELQKLKNVYNNNTDKVPGAVKSLIGGQRINLHIEDQTYSMEMKKAKIESLEKGELENPSLEVWADQEDVEQLNNSDNPGQELRKKLNNGDIKYKKYGFVNRIRFAVFELFL